jgi:hypothetical protein
LEEGMKELESLKEYDQKILLTEKIFESLKIREQ